MIDYRWIIIVIAHENNMDVQPTILITKSGIAYMVRHANVPDISHLQLRHWQIHNDNVLYLKSSLKYQLSSSLTTTEFSGHILMESQKEAVLTMEPAVAELIAVLTVLSGGGSCRGCFGSCFPHNPITPEQAVEHLSIISFTFPSDMPVVGFPIALTSAATADILPAPLPV
jgi:hypothetical protein